MACIFSLLRCQWILLRPYLRRHLLSILDSHAKGSKGVEAVTSPAVKTILVLHCPEKLQVPAAFLILKGHKPELSASNTHPQTFWSVWWGVLNTRRQENPKSWLPLSGYPQPTFYTCLKEIIPPFCQTEHELLSQYLLLIHSTNIRSHRTWPWGVMNNCNTHWLQMRGRGLWYPASRDAPLISWQHNCLLFNTTLNGGFLRKTSKAEHEARKHFS